MPLVGLIEEAAKLIVPFILLLFLRRLDPRAGVIIGGASGMGFATLETMGYGFTALLSHGSWAALEKTLLLRALLSPAGLLPGPDSPWRRCGQFPPRPGKDVRWAWPSSRLWPLSCCTPLGMGSTA